MKTQKELMDDLKSRFYFNKEQINSIEIALHRERQEAIKRCKRFIREHCILDKNSYKYYPVLSFEIEYYSITDEELKQCLK